MTDHELTRADFLNEIIRITNQDYQAVRRIKDHDAALRAERDEWERKCREICAAHGALLIAHNDLTKERDALKGRLREEARQ